jgi:hypothetical protein
MPLLACLVALLLMAPAALAQAPPAQITIAQPAEATTMDPGRSTQVLTVNWGNTETAENRGGPALSREPPTGAKAGRRHPPRN